MFAGREVALIAGDYFGEESLVADTLRNATVTMDADGAVARLGREVFDQLVRTASRARSRRCTHGAQFDGDERSALAIIDVRFPHRVSSRCVAGEYQYSDSAVALARLGLLDKTRLHLITRHGGRRSELAVFLLRQAGIEAYLMASQEHRFSHIEVFPRDAFVGRIA